MTLFKWKVVLIVTIPLIMSVTTFPLELKGDITESADPMTMSNNELMFFFGINPIKDAETREKVAQWTAESQSNPEELGHYYQGDIHILNNRRKRYGLIDEQFRWPDGIVPYAIRPGEFGEVENNINILFREDEMVLLNRAFDDYEKLTDGCIRWVPRTDEENYVIFTSAMGGCFAVVGMKGGPQMVNLQVPNCINEDSYGTVQHEMLHALGVEHEQSRYDRDEYVEVLFDNVLEDPKFLANFEILGLDKFDPFGGPYDYGSVMHYSRKSFSKNGEDTIKPIKVPDAEIGQRAFFSDLDLFKLRNMYGCIQDPEPKTETIGPEVKTGVVEIIEPEPEIIEIIEPGGTEIVEPFIEIIEPEIGVVEPFVEIIEPETGIVDPFIGPIDPTEVIEIIEFDALQKDKEERSKVPKQTSLPRPIRITVKLRNSSRNRDLALRLKIKT